jgi:hypothetical protein
LLVVRNLDESARRDGQVCHAIVDGSLILSDSDG